ncbi:kinesin KIF2A isoform X4 [Brachionus plicatilis]|uniref:Kinesin KIF2A isoform X4 n=1 Tax=Brachionus plicatilis TaxID=10195 RepID=A0A3M7RA95_BRAPC|nr:kinesin KIF2A isoform X4 [Brachionus plicatilis]
MRRKSNMVKEIEKIKKNREQRRATQEEKRQKLNEIDTSVPAWEVSPLARLHSAHKHLARARSCKFACVCARGPSTKNKISKKDIDVITMPNKDLCLVHLPKCKVDLTKYLDNQKFRLDFAFHESTSNDLVYRYTAQPLVNNIFQGGNAMYFA